MAVIGGGSGSGSCLAANEYSSTDRLTVGWTTVGRHLFMLVSRDVARVIYTMRIIAAVRLSVRRLQSVGIDRVAGILSMKFHVISTRTALKLSESLTAKPT